MQVEVLVSQKIIWSGDYLLATSPKVGRIGLFRNSVGGFSDEETPVFPLLDLFIQNCGADFGHLAPYGTQAADHAAADGNEKS